MIVELAKHIENLLLEHDCVIIPGFGGFIVQHISARRVEAENLFLPPYRTVGFNPNLQLNDGLLVQSYMQAYDANYPEAYKLVEDAVDSLRQQLSALGDVKIPGVGKLVQNIEGSLDFYPNEEGVLSPMLYGLGSFEMEELTEETIVMHPASVAVKSEKKQKHNTLVIRINRKWLNNAVAVAAAVILFFFLSTPVDNTYVEPDSYASIGDVGLFDQIRSQSVATSLVKVPVQAATVAASKAKTVSKAKATAPKAKPASAPKEKSATALNVKTTTTSADTKPATTNNAAGQRVAQNIVSEPIQTVKTPETKPVVAKTETPKAKPVPVANAATASVKQKAPVQTQPVKQEAPKQAVSTKRYHIIVASVTNRADAEKSIQYFAGKGYPGATVVEADGRVRIAIASFADRKSADVKWAELRQLELFQNAWIFASRKK